MWYNPHTSRFLGICGALVSCPAVAGSGGCTNAASVTASRHVAALPCDFSEGCHQKAGQRLEHALVQWGDCRDEPLL